MTDTSRTIMGMFVEHMERVINGDVTAFCLSTANAEGHVTTAYYFPEDNEALVAELVSASHRVLEERKCLDCGSLYLGMLCPLCVAAAEVRLELAVSEPAPKVVKVAPVEEGGY